VTDELTEQPAEEAVPPPEKPKKEKKAKKADKKAAPAANENVVALAGHPRAKGAIARLRSGAGLGAAVFVAFMSYRAGVPLDHCILRGLTAGIVGYMVGWYVGVTVWRQLIRAELRAAMVRRAAALQEAEQQ
jgi:hypothetical protein